MLQQGAALPGCSWCHHECSLNHQGYPWCCCRPFLSFHTLLVVVKPSWVFIWDHSRTRSSYLIISDSIYQLLEKSTQDFGVIDVPYEFEKCVLFREWSKFCDNPIELPGSEVSKSACVYTSTNLRSSTLLAFSA